MSTSAGMQAALLIREKQRLRRKKFRKGRSELPSHIATREIGPFPQYPPGFMCSQGRAAWQERERGRRCSLSEEARQHRIKQTEAHHRWMKRNRIHDSTYGGGSDDEDFFNVYHQSAAANALLYVGLGTTAIGSVIFFVGTGEKGFKTLELRLIGPTLIACGLLCCLIRVLLCAVPSTCFQKRKKTCLKNDTCLHSSSRYPLNERRTSQEASLLKHHHHSNNPNHNHNHPHLYHNHHHHQHKKKVSIVPPNHSLPSTSTSEFKEPPRDDSIIIQKPSTIIPQIHLPEDITNNINIATASNNNQLSRNDSIIELQNLELSYDIQSISSYDSDKKDQIDQYESGNNCETSLSVVIENNKSEGRKDNENLNNLNDKQSTTHSGIVLSPLQLGQ